MFILSTISPPYCGAPSLSHQLPVVGAEVALFIDVAAEGMGTPVDVVAVLEFVAVELEQDVSNIASPYRQMKLNNVTLFFTFSPISIT